MGHLDLLPCTELAKSFTILCRSASKLRGWEAKTIKFHPSLLVTCSNGMLKLKFVLGGQLSTPWYKSCYRKYPPARTLCYCCYLQILAASLSFYLLAPSFCYLALAKTYEKSHGSSIVSAIRVRRLDYLPGAKFEKTWRTLSPTFNCI